MDFIALHIGTDHVWSLVPMAVVGGLVVFLGAVVVREKLQRWSEEDEEREASKRNS